MKKNTLSVKANTKEAYSVVRQLNFDKKSLVSVYPNPVQSGSMLTLQLTNSPVAPSLSVEIFSISGKKVSEQTITANSSPVFQLPALLPGQYFLKVPGNQMVICSTSFIVVK